MEAAFLAEIEVCKETFQAMISAEERGTVLTAAWKNERHHRIDLQEISAELGMELPDFLTFCLELKQIAIQYRTKGHLLLLHIGAENGWKLALGAGFTAEKFFVQVHPGAEILWKKFPLLGKYMDADDFLKIVCIKVVYEPAKQGKNENGTVSAQYLLEAGFAGKHFEFGSDSRGWPIDLREMEEVISGPDSTLALPSDSRESEQDKGWISVKKQIGPCMIRRVKVSFEEGEIVVALDAAVTISVLTLDFLELQARINLAKILEPSFGLQGLAVSVSKDPLFISGGLYYEKKEDKYTGELTIQYQQFSFVGLGSYQPAAEGRKEAFFAYLFVGYAFGGPPCFYVTGLAAGFGVNQKIQVPDIWHIADFPFIQAAEGKKKAGNAGEILEAAGSYIKTEEGSDFITAGVRFTSFGMVESIVLLNVEFGRKLEISLLGLSQMDLPPKASNPIVHGTLALKAVFCPEDGILQIEGALTSEAYIFTKDCHITGGFAFYSWFSGEHAGDFVITVGGYHPNFQKKPHYPTVERVGIRWNISKELSLSGEAYFALVPSCLMAGGKLDLLYQAGKLKAWCHLAADFLIQWNPFYYDIAVSASLGVSYRLDLLFIHHTFTLEVSASMHLWGPEFAGEVRIKWSIISFTIGFNRNSKRGALPICWKEFRERFLDEKPGELHGIENKDFPLVKVGIARGKLKEAEGVFYIDKVTGKIRIESQMPCQRIVVQKNGKEGQKEIVAKGQNGIVPMGMSSLKAELFLHIQKEGTDGKWQDVAVDGEGVFMDAPSALWDVKQPDMNQGMLPGLLKGYSFIPQDQKGPALPEDPARWYDMQILLENEEHLAKGRPLWHEVEALLDHGNKKADYQAMGENPIRDEWLSQLSEPYKVQGPEEIDASHFSQHVQELLFAPFICMSTGTRNV